MGKHDINAFLGAGTSFTGRLLFDGVVRIDGEFDGEIESSGTLLVGRNARITGRVRVGRLACGGFVAADVEAASMVSISGTGRVAGSVRTPVLVMEEGGGLDGDVVMEAAPSPAALAGNAGFPEGD